MILALYALAVLLTILDGLTTVVGLRIGASEAARATRWLINKLGVIEGVTATVVFRTVILIILLILQQTWFLIFAIGLNAVVVGHNLTVLRQLRSD